MPIMIVGADTPLGGEIADRFLAQDREVRVFVTDEEAADRFRGAGAKVATGDVSDDSHLSGACLHCFSVVLVEEASRDQRVRSFAATPEEVHQAWAKAVQAAGVPRVIWVIDGEPPGSDNREVFAVRPDQRAVESVFERDRAKPPR